jgi:hypothetical protein
MSSGGRRILCLGIQTVAPLPACLCAVRCAARPTPVVRHRPCPPAARVRRFGELGEKNERERACNPSCESETGGRRWEHDFGPPEVKTGRSASLGHRWERKPCENWAYLPVQVFRLLYFCFFIYRHVYVLYA